MIIVTVTLMMTMTIICLWCCGCYEEMLCFPDNGFISVICLVNLVLMTTEVFGQT